MSVSTSTQRPASSMLSGRDDDLPIIGSRTGAGSATMRADFDLPESPLMSACQTPIIVALDFPARDAALKLADPLDPKLCRVKVGKELFTSCASESIGRAQGWERGCQNVC